MNLQIFNEKLSNTSDKLIFAFFISITLLYWATDNILLKEQVSICLVGLLFSFLMFFKPSIFLTKQGYLSIKVFCLMAMLVISFNIAIRQIFIVIL